MWPLLLVTSALVASMSLVAMSLYLTYVNADALLYGLISTQHLTFYYWGQDRLANVVPALLSPVHDLTLNFRLQMWLVGCSFYALLFAFVSGHLEAAGVRTRRPVTAPWALVVVASVAAASLKPLTSYQFVLEQQYGLSMLLFLLGAFALVRARRVGLRAAGFVVVVIALLIIPSSVLLVIVVWPMALGQRRPLQRMLWSAVTVGVAFLVTNVCQRLFYRGPTSSAYNNFSISRAVSGLRPALEQICTSIRPTATVVSLAASAIVLLLRRAHVTRRASAIIIGAWLFGFAWLVVFAGNEWVELNGYSYRYFFPLYGAGLYFCASASAEFVRATSDRLSAVRNPNPSRIGSIPWHAGVVGAVAVALAVWGVARQPSDRDLPVLAAAGPPADTARALSTDFVVGDYWRVWPIVFAGRSDGENLFGVTVRSEALRGQIDAAVARAEATGEAVNVLCVGVEQVGCAGSLGALVGGSWVVTDVLSETPLVVEVGPAPT